VAYPLFLTKLLIRAGMARCIPGARHASGGADFFHYYSDRVLGAPFQAMLGTARYLEATGPDTIDLALGAPRFDLVPSASTKLPADRRGWPPLCGLPELREAIALKLHREQKLAVDPGDEVLVTSGAAGAFNVVIDALLNPGARVVLFDPTSPLYSMVLRQRHARIRWIPTWMENGRTRFRLDHLAKSLRGARLLVLNSPGNPTGGIIAAEDLEQIAWWADRYDVLILNDAVFAAYQYDGVRRSIGTFQKAQRRTLTIGSVSKEFALAATRVGWVAGHPHLVRPCALTAALQAPFVATVCQQIALTALQQQANALSALREKFDSRRRYTHERLRAMGLKPELPAGAFFFWVPTASLGVTGRRLADELLAAKRLLVTPGEFFGPSGAAFVRVSYAAEDGRLREGLSRMAEYVRDRQSATSPRRAA
jgi:aspartate/methionine/tyrosine aminotransferase